MPQTLTPPQEVGRPVPPESAVTGGNRLTLFDDGEALFDRVTDAMRTAKARIWIETFILTPDETGRAALTMAAAGPRRWSRRIRRCSSARANRSRSSWPTSYRTGGCGPHCSPPPRAVWTCGC
jgi:phosphatidylserine/phosphatidylglycerophosphate/cardiolipin synthase-like enzyme